MIKKGADVNKQDRMNGNTPLHNSAINSKIEINVNLIPFYQYFHIILYFFLSIFATTTNKQILGNLKVVDLLLTNGANISALSKDGRTPLHWAAYNSNYLFNLLFLCSNVEKKITIHNFSE